MKLMARIKATASRASPRAWNSGGMMEAYAHLHLRILSPTIRCHPIWLNAAEPGDAARRWGVNANGLEGWAQSPKRTIVSLGQLPLALKPALPR